MPLMHGWACIDYGPKLACGQLDRTPSIHAYPCINFHKIQVVLVVVAAAVAALANTHNTVPSVTDQAVDILAEVC